MSHNQSILSAQYNNVATAPGNLSEIRGTGSFTTKGMSSNWYSDNIDNHYTKNLSDDVLQMPRPSEGYDASVGPAPYLPRKNDNFLYTDDQSNFPPGSRESLKGDPYLQFGLQSTQDTPTALNSLFFSQTNVTYIQNRILNDVEQLTGIRIKPQSENTILIVMRNKYEYAKSGWLPAQSVVHLALPRGEKSCSLRDRLNRLNQAVLQDLVQQVLSGISMYMQYYKDASSMPMPLDNPKVMTMKGSRVIPYGNVGMYDEAAATARDIASYNMRGNIIN